MKAIVPFILAAACFGCSSQTTPFYKRSAVTDRLVPMTHAEAKEAGYSFLDRNSDQVWAYPPLLFKGMQQFSR